MEAINVGAKLVVKSRTQTGRIERLTGIVAAFEMRDEHPFVMLLDADGRTHRLYLDVPSISGIAVFGK